MSGLLAGMGDGYQKPAKKHTVPKKGGEGATTGGKHTQVGEMDDEIKVPTPAMRIKSIAKDEKIHATRRWIAGEISNAQHTKIHSRANHAIKHAGKLGK